MKPGLHLDVPELDYHAGMGADEPSLSVSGAKRILDSPARFRWERDNPPAKKVFDFGHAAHKKVLGVGLDVVACPPDLLASNGAASTTKAKEWIAQAKADGKVVLSAKDIAVIDAMAHALDASEAADLFREGQPEVSMLWRDKETNVLLRGRADWITTYHGVPLIVDYKTTGTANPEAFAWEAGRLDYPMQDDWYREGAEACTGDPHGFVFVAQEKTEPYLVSVIELDDETREIGAQRNAVARRLYLDCMTRDQWPAYPGIHRVTVRNTRPAKEAAHV